MFSAIAKIKDNLGSQVTISQDIANVLLENLFSLHLPHLLPLSDSSFPKTSYTNQLSDILLILKNVYMAIFRISSPKRLDKDSFLVLVWQKL